MLLDYNLRFGHTRIFESHRFDLVLKYHQLLEEDWQA
mgnify:CR=1 FL=1